MVRVTTYNPEFEQEEARDYDFWWENEDGSFSRVIAGETYYQGDLPDEFLELEDPIEFVAVLAQAKPGDFVSIKKKGLYVSLFPADWTPPLQSWLGMDSSRLVAQKADSALRVALGRVMRSIKYDDSLSYEGLDLGEMRNAVWPWLAKIRRAI